MKLMGRVAANDWYHWVAENFKLKDGQAGGASNVPWFVPKLSDDHPALTVSGGAFANRPADGSIGGYDGGDNDDWLGYSYWIHPSNNEGGNDGPTSSVYFGASAADPNTQWLPNGAGGPMYVRLNGDTTPIENITDSLFNASAFKFMAASHPDVDAWGSPPADVASFIYPEADTSPIAGADITQIEFITTWIPRSVLFVPK